MDLYIGLRIRIRVLLFSSVAVKMPKNLRFFKIVFCLLLTTGTFTLVFKDNKSLRSTKQKIFLIILLFGMIRSVQIIKDPDLILEAIEKNIINLMK